MSPEEVLEYVTIQERKVGLEEELPHLYSFKWYAWARDFFESRDKLYFLVAGNQLSKSSTQIRRTIHWATEQSLWPELWQQTPNQFWYLYPDKNVATAEFHKKWSLFLPRGKMKDDPKYGWREEFDKKKIVAIHFNSGVTVYFKTYAQDVSSLQSGTVFYIACDEELPVELYDELIFRITAVDGFFSIVFTATLGQEFWREVMEPDLAHGEEEKLPEARKARVSLYDSQFYEDGSPSQWTDQRIKTVIARCKDHNEVLKRVWGRFIVDKEGRKYAQFDVKRHTREKHPLPRDWTVWSAVDPGSGGTAHPAGILFLGVSPDFRQGRVFAAWRGDNVGDTTSGDVFNKHQEIKHKLKLRPVQQLYDPAAKDFYLVASRNGESFIKANKSTDEGVDLVNVLFKNDMLMLYEDPEILKLATELSSLRKATLKRNAKDNLADPLRYLCMAVPWDLTGIVGEEMLARIQAILPEEELNEVQRQIRDRRKEMETEHGNEESRIEEEFSEWNEHYGA